MTPTLGHFAAVAAGTVQVVLLIDVVAASATMRATTRRTVKVAALAEVLAAAAPDELAAVTAFLAGEATHQPLSVGPSTIRAVEVAPAGAPTLEVHEVDAAFARLAAVRGPGSSEARRAVLASLLGRATADEQEFVIALVLGELRQGALAGLAAQGIARAFAVPEPVVRRAVMLRADLGAVALAAATGGEEALSAFRLEVLRAVQPMLASTASDLGEAMAGMDHALVEAKLDGARVQVHRRDDVVRVFTRSLRDATFRLPGVVAVAQRVPAETFVLDGEVLGLDPTGRPEPFQQTMRRFGAPTDLEQGDRRQVEAQVSPFFFDALHIDGRDLLDEPLRVRRQALTSLIPQSHLVAGRAATSVADGESVATRALDDGHEGVVVKDLGAAYAAGRRGTAWRKVKPVHTLDLVVLAVEWGSGRRRGWLSNLHLGALDDRSGEPVMLGKTFKGLTDELLEWQTARFLELQRERRGHVVVVDPVQVVEVAVDGVQSSPRYPAGMALRFARVLRYRHDKRADEADTVGTVRAIHTGRRTPGLP